MTAATPFRPVSTTLNETIPKDIRHDQGIYFTPASIRARLFTLVRSQMSAPARVLEPSFGSGEFIHDALTIFPPSTKAHGVELNTTNFKETIKSLYNGTYSKDTLQRLTLKNTDFLTYSAPPADLIIGNPPFCVTTLKDPRCMTGRGNLFVLFLYKCLTEHLVPGGILAFVLPTAFYNCVYYNPCRAYIRDHTTILAAEKISGTDAGFYETAQDTMLLVIRNTPTSSLPFLLSVPASDAVYITPHAAELQPLIAAATTIKALGASVKTGEVVWNQHKEKLTENPETPSALIIYANNIKHGALTIGDPGKNKKQYIRGFTGKPPTEGPALVVSRGYGNTAYSINCALVPAGTIFYGENHVNVITAPSDDIIHTIHTSLKDPRTTLFLDRFLGNGALSKTELESVLPIWTTTA